MKARRPAFVLPERVPDRPLSFSWHVWEYPAGSERRGLTCDACDCNASYPVEATAPHADHLFQAPKHVCQTFQYEWDEWRREAWERGMEREAAQAGRALIRECHQHAWPWEPDTRAMMVRGLRDPKGAARRWSRLLDHGNDRELAGLPVRTPAVRS
jgi:hypothetical protein